MTRMYRNMKLAALSALLLSGSALVATQSAEAAMMKTANGQAYWSGDPGPIHPDAFWVGDEYKYDPNHFLGFWSQDPADYTDVVYAPHSGGARCVWRKRVVNSAYEFEHPYLKVCRP